MSLPRSSLWRLLFGVLAGFMLATLAYRPAGFGNLFVNKRSEITVNHFLSPVESKVNQTLAAPLSPSGALEGSAPPAPPVAKRRPPCEVYKEDASRNRTIKFNIFNSPVEANATLTMATHMTSARLEVLKMLAAAWKGPISVALYCNQSELSEFSKQFNKSPILIMRNNIYIHHILTEGTYYPVNFLRNVAVDFCTTSQYLFLNDVDFIPSDGAQEIVLKYINAWDVTNKQVLVVPAFEALKAKMIYPPNKQILLEQWNNKLLDIFQRSIFPPSHKPTDYEKWRTATASYQIKYEELYEPYIVMKRDLVPRYDQRFVSRYRDKISHALTINSLGFSFLVLPNAYLIHIYHPTAHKQEHVFPCALALYNRLKKELQDKAKTSSAS